MKPSVQKIVAKLAKEQEKEANVKLEKVELARKPINILNKLETLDKRIDTVKAQMEKAYIAYRQKRNDFVNKMETIREQSIDSKEHLIDAKNAAKDLGVDPDLIDGYKEAVQKQERVESGSRSIQKLYPEI